MNKAINRTTVQTGDNKFRLYPKNAPLFYKDSNGNLNDIDLTFNDTTSSIGEISLMDKGIVSVGKRKGNNPHKVVGIRPDNNQHLGTQQLEFSLISVNLDGEVQDFNVETDLELKLSLSKVFQLVKLNKEFRNCKIEFDIHTEGLEIVNAKYDSNTTIADYGFKLTNIGDNNGSTTLGMYNAYSGLNKDIPYLDCYVGKITDEYITTGQYTIEEEFGDSELTEYILEQMYPNGSSIYYKDSLIFACKPYNILNFEDIIVNNICSIYKLEIFNDGGSGIYFTKDNKKVGGYYSNEKTFFAFFNTCDIPDKIKTLFQRKSFEDTSFLDITLQEFHNNIDKQFNLDLKIELDDSFYKPLKNTFEFKIKNESMYIGLPLAFDEDYNVLDYSTTHSLKDNEDGSYRYTKYIKPETSLNINKAQYLDTAVYVAHAEDGNMLWSKTLQPANAKTSANFTEARNGEQALSTLGDGTGADHPMLCAGERVVKIESGGQSASTTYQFNLHQTHYYFNTSSISETINEARMVYPKSARNTTGCSSANDISLIALKSTLEGNAPTLLDWNEFEGFTANWSESDVIEYSGEVVITSYNETTATAGNFVVHSSYTSNTIPLNSTACTDIEDDDAFNIAVIDYDQYYLNNLTSDPNGSVTANRLFITSQIDHSDSAYRPYLEYNYEADAPVSTGGGLFFGANF